MVFFLATFPAKNIISGMNNAELKINDARPVTRQEVLEIVETALEKAFDRFAIMMQREFALIHAKFKQIDERFDRNEAYMEMKFAQIDRRFDRIEGILRGHHQRISALEEQNAL